MRPGHGLALIWCDWWGTGSRAGWFDPLQSTCNCTIGDSQDCKVSHPVCEWVKRFESRAREVIYKWNPFIIFFYIFFLLIHFWSEIDTKRHVTRTNKRKRKKIPNLLHSSTHPLPFTIFFMMNKYIHSFVTSYDYFKLKHYVQQTIAI